MMLFSQSRNRGFTITAALIFAALLTLVAAAVQATVPAVTSPASLSASAQVATPTSSSGTPDIQAVARPVDGKDMVVLFFEGKYKIRYFPVCEPAPKGTVQQWFEKALAGGILKKDQNSKVGLPDDTRCKIDPATKDSPDKKWFKNESPWKEWTFLCFAPDAQFFDTSPGAAISAPGGNIANLSQEDVLAIKKSEGDPRVICRVLPPGTSSGNPTPATGWTRVIPAPVQTAQPANMSGGAIDSSDLSPPQSVVAPEIVSNNLPSTLLGSAYETQMQIDTVTQQIRTLENREYEISRELSKLAACTEFPSASDTCVQEKDQEQVTKLQNEKQASEALRNQYLAQLQLLQNRSVVLGGGPNQNLGAILNPSGGTSPSQNGGTPRIQMPTLPNLGSSNFSNPALGANNIPVSPFGGSCATRYICSGGVLYYQSANSYGSYGYSGAQCQTQVVQRCAYGCASLNGSNSTADGLGGIMSMIGGLFGGNSSATANSSNSCAYSPQNAQSQNQFGLGNLGKLLFGGDDEGSQSQTCPRAPAQPDASQCTSGSWRPTSASRNGCTTGWQCVSATGGSASNPNPTAQLSCTPQIVESGSQVKLNYTCGNSTASKGTGFDTGGALSGTATAVASPPDGQNLATYTLTCLNQGVTTSAQCQVQINKSQIILVTNPSRVVSGETSLIGWVTSGMKSCTVSSLEQQDFTTRNVGITSVNGAASTSPITGLTHFQLDCQTHSGTIKTAATTVNLK